MTAIDSKTEQRIQETLLKASFIQVDGGRVYFASYQGEKYLRYTEGAKCITFSGRTEKPDPFSYANLLSNLLAGRYPRIYVVEVGTPLSWDAESDSMPSPYQEVVLDRVKRAILKRYSGYRIAYL